MEALIACEESQAVTTYLRRYGVDAFSCDIMPTSGKHPEWHITGDVTPLLKKPINLLIAFPPCTHLAVSGARWFKEKRESGEQQRAIDFFMLFVNANAKHKAIENPVSIMSTIYRKPDQYIQPWQFGHGEVKKTCLWLENLPKLQPGKIVDGREQAIWKMPPSKDRSILRSKTYDGIARAMANQWGEYAI